MFHDVIYSFHMPLFFILAGYTLKPVEDRDIPWLALKDLKRLIVPCLIARCIIFAWNCFFMQAELLQELKTLCLSMLWGNFYPTFFSLAMPAVGRIWFLFALFWAKSAYRFLLNRFDDHSRMPLLSMAALFSMIIGRSGLILPQNFDMLFLCIFFMELGYSVKRSDTLWRINNWGLLLIFSVWTYLVTIQSPSLDMNTRRYPGYGLCIILAVLGSICVAFFSKSVEDTIIAKPLVFFGKNSIILLVVHSVAPSIFTATNRMEKLMDMTIQCLLVIVYVFAKRYSQILLKKLRSKPGA